jgi:hypothetical protein
MNVWRAAIVAPTGSSSVLASSEAGVEPTGVGFHDVVGVLLKMAGVS